MLGRIPYTYRKNTQLARRLARLYERVFDEPFPGGIENAAIERTRAGHWQRSSGAWSWFLCSIDTVYGVVRHFGSAFPAREAERDPRLLDGDFHRSYDSKGMPLDPTKRKG